MAVNENEDIYRGIDTSAYGLGKTIGDAGRDAVGFGRTIGQIGTGLYNAAGDTVSGMRAAAQPYFDKQFANMERQGRDFREGLGNFSRGVKGAGGDYPYAEDASAGNAQLERAKATGDAIDAKYFKSGPSTVPPAGVNMFGAGGSNGPIGGNDSYRAMADQLYGLSQQRAGTEGSIGVNGYMQQLNNIRALNASTPMGGIGILSDGGIEAQNAEKTQRWAQEEMLRKAQNNPQLQHTIGALIQAQNSNAINERNVAGRLNELGIQGENQKALEMMRGGVQMGIEGLRGQNQLAGYRMQGENQLAAEGLRGRNQLQNTREAYGMQGDNQMGLEMLKQGYQERDPLRQAQVGEANARAGLYGVQKEGAQKQLEFDKSFDGSVQRWASTFIKDGGMSPDQAIAMALKMAMGGRRAAEQHANGGLVGYADGGEVEGKESAEQILARMHAKYGVPAAGPEAPQPAPQQPQQQAPAPAPRQETWSEKLRRMATGGLEQRMRGFAEGGPINVGGRQVLGEGDGKSDSLPAVIDGERPAALSTGEFVMPVEAVQHFGLDRLNKMVAAARKGLDTSR